MARSRICKPCLWIALLGIGFLFIWYFKVLALGYYWLGTSVNAAQWEGSSLWLPGYRAVVEARQIEGLTRNTSGLTFNTETGTLFTVIIRCRLALRKKVTPALPVAPHILQTDQDVEEGAQRWHQDMQSKKEQLFPPGPRFARRFKQSVDGPTVRIPQEGFHAAQSVRCGALADLGVLQEHVELFRAALQWPNQTARNKNIKAIEFMLRDLVQGRQTFNPHWSSKFLQSLPKSKNRTTTYERVSQAMVNRYAWMNGMSYKAMVEKLAAVKKLSGGDLCKAILKGGQDARGWIQLQCEQKGLNVPLPYMERLGASLKNTLESVSRRKGAKAAELAMYVELNKLLGEMAVRKDLEVMNEHIVELRNASKTTGAARGSTSTVSTQVTRSKSSRSLNLNLMKSLNVMRTADQATQMA